LLLKHVSKEGPKGETPNRRDIQKTAEEPDGQLEMLFLSPVFLHVPPRRTSAKSVG
jgi:hypothetical protein